MQFWCFLAFVGAIFAVTAPPVGACKGCVSLDDYNFDKIIPRFKTVMVKFDVAYPFGDKHDAFAKLAEEIAPNPDLILAQVGVKDYGEKENEALALKFGISKDDLPAIRLFRGYLEDPVEFSKDGDWSLDHLRNLIRDNTEIHLVLPGCLEQFDKVAMKFLSVVDKQNEIKETEKVVQALPEKDKDTGKTYVKFMRKILEDGPSFVKRELGRLAKILTEGKVNEKKRTELTQRLNILRSFSLAKDEL